MVWTTSTSPFTPSRGERLGEEVADVGEVGELAERREPEEAGDEQDVVRGPARGESSPPGARRRPSRT